MSDRPYGGSLEADLADWHRKRAARELQEYLFFESIGVEEVAKERKEKADEDLRWAQALESGNLKIN